ncbi:MAG: Lrp/AsnC ligand binding domain-containing protein [Candidatus Bathyarchaeota archaeon]|nr:Lrp/AsnC ligand binding domain-containing protein [Candidatus Bathyarchaeota archaeon]
MVTAYVLLRVKPGMDKDVFLNVKRLLQVKEVVVVYGEYDLLVRIEVPSMEDLDTFIFDTIRMILGVESSTTLIKIKKPSKS